MLEIPKPVYYDVFTFITGIFLYIIVRDTLLKYGQGKPTYFLTGVIVYLFLVAIETVLT